MARSRRKTPVLDFYSESSQRADKRALSRLERRTIWTVLSANPEVEVLPVREELSDSWDMVKERKVYQRFDLDPKDMRK
jgi:hypothetical protein